MLPDVTVSREPGSTLRLSRRQKHRIDPLIEHPHPMTDMVTNQP